MRMSMSAACLLLAAGGALIPAASHAANPTPVRPVPVPFPRHAITTGGPVAEFGGKGSKQTNPFMGTRFYINWLYRCTSPPNHFTLTLTGKAVPHGRAQVASGARNYGKGRVAVGIGKGLTPSKSGLQIYRFNVSTGSRCAWSIDVRNP